eukprot:gene11693-11838_t
MQDDMVANTATTFFKALLLQLRRESAQSDDSLEAAGRACLPLPGTTQAGSQEAAQSSSKRQQQLLSGRDLAVELLQLIADARMRAWCGMWLPEVLGVLWGPDERFRTYVVNHALPVILAQEPLLLRPLVAIILAAHEATTNAAQAAAGSPYERKYFALELLVLLLQQWGPASSSHLQTRKRPGPSAVAVPQPMAPELLSPGAVEVLLGCLVDSWDKLRLVATRVLELMPAPLPGWSAPDQLQQLLTWALQLTQSPRVRESDAGARLLRLLYVKYALALGWQLQDVAELVRPVLCAQRGRHVTTGLTSCEMFMEGAGSVP